MNNITIAGAGSGSFAHLTHEVKNAIEEAEIIAASPRFANLIPAGKNFIALGNFHETFDKLRGGEKILILTSGDPCLYSVMPLAKKFFGDVRVLPGVSSLQILCALAGETWNGASILSGHGRSLSPGIFLNTVERNEKTILFCDSNISPSWACEGLKNFDSVDVFIGSNLGSTDEIFLHGKPSFFTEKNFPELSIMLVKNSNVYKPKRTKLRDSDFIREKNIVMTNESVRAVILSRLELNEESVLWDIGAGSGSVSISAAHENISLDVHAVERNSKAVSLIKRNAEKFHLHNVEVHEGLASEVLETLPDPSHVFIGGSGGELEKIFACIKRVNAPVRVVLACVTLETFHQAYELMKDMTNFEAVQILAVRGEGLGVRNEESLTLMKANNPVMILSANAQNFQK
ncbi:MAG: precorrin-6Y C5,15-methyltransferase (decarboxylating) subunit CbiT [Synergistaceae bacterium]|nr:precorrin-6Y C5,15-methyltransferase (decarboxylating) subunit CbiT [Synergistaceae bacterium]